MVGSRPLARGASGRRATADHRHCYLSAEADVEGLVRDAPGTQQLADHPELVEGFGNLESAIAQQTLTGTGEKANQSPVRSAPLPAAPSSCGGRDGHQPEYVGGQHI